MTEAEDFRDSLTDAIEEYGSSVTITPITLTEGSYGGYEPLADTEGTTVSTKGLPSENLISKEGEPFGKLKAGEVVIVLKYDETVEKDYKLTWQGDDYTVNDIKTVRMQDTVIGKRVKLTRELD